MYRLFSPPVILQETGNRMEIISFGTVLFASGLVNLYWWHQVSTVPIRASRLFVSHQVSVNYDCGDQAVVGSEIRHSSGVHLKVFYAPHHKHSPFHYTS